MYALKGVLGMRFLKSIVTVAALCATFASAAISPDAGGYYNLATANDLREFVSLVNGGESTDPQPGLNARLTQNIQLVDFSIVSFNDTGADINLPKYNTISPMQNFSGTFDGQGFSISGLYIGGLVVESTSETTLENGEVQKDTTWTYAREAGFIINLNDKAVIKDLRIVDSYFSANKQVGSLAARASGNVTIQGYQFSGVIKADSLQRKCPSDDEVCNSNSESIVGDTVGGVIGHVQSGATLSMSNMIVESWFTHNMKENGGRNVGGFIGVNDGKMDFYSCYSKVLIVNKRDRGVQGKNNKTDDAKVNSHGSVYCSGTGDKCNVKSLCTEPDRDANGVVKKDSEGKEKIKDITNINVCREIFGDKLTEALNKDSSYKATGVSYEYTNNKLIAHITEWTRENPNWPENPGTIVKTKEDGKDSVLEYLKIPQDIYVDSVDFDRIFSGKSSTIMLPFDIESSRITATSKCIVEEGETFEPLKFNKFNGSSSIKYNENKQKYEINATTEVSEIKASTPYLVDGLSGQMHFCGPVTLKKITPESRYEYVSSIQNDWKLVGTYKTMLTTSEGSSAYESSSNLGKIYGFVGTQNVPYIGESTFSIGQFAKAGHNVRTREMRAYLIYSGKNIAPNAAPPYRNMNRAAPATTVLDLSDEDLPNAIDVIVEEKEIVIPPRTFIKDTTVMSPVIVSTIRLEYPSAEDDDEENAEEGTTAITKPFISPLKSNKVESWRDIKGRRLNGRPNVPGTYFKNGIPVIIK